MYVIAALCILCGCVAPHACRSVDPRDAQSQDLEPFVAHHHHEGNIAELLIPLLERSLAQNEASKERHNRRSKAGKKVIQVLPYRGSEEHKRKGWRKLNSRKKQVVEITPLHGKNRAKPLAYILSAAKPSHKEHAKRREDLSSNSASDLEHDKFSSEEQQSSEEEQHNLDSEEVSPNALRNAAADTSDSKESKDLSASEKESSADLSKEIASGGNTSRKPKGPNKKVVVIQESTEDNTVRPKKTAKSRNHKKHPKKRILTVEDKDITAEEESVTAEDKDVTVEELAITVEGRAFTAEDADVTSEDVALTSEDVTLTSEDVALTAEDKAVTAEEITKTVEEDVLTAEDKALSAEERAVTSEDKTAEDTLTAEDKTLTAEELVVTSEDKTAEDALTATTKEELDLTAEDKTTTTEDKNFTAEDQPLTAEDKAVTEEDQLLTAEEQAVTAEDKAVTAEDEAVTAEDEAVTAEDEAVTAEDKAVTSEDKAVTAEDKAVTSEDKAVTSEDEAVTAEDKAVTAEDKAVTAEDEAVTAEDKAVTAEEQALTAEEDAVNIGNTKSPHNKHYFHHKHLSRAHTEQNEDLSEINDLLGKLNLQQKQTTEGADTSPEQHSEFIENDIVISRGGHRDAESAEKSFGKLFNARARDIIELIQSSVEASTAPHRDCNIEKADSRNHDHKSYRLSFLFNK